MNSAEIQVLRDVSWDSGWNAALHCAALTLRSRILRQGITLAEIADELERLKVGAAAPCRKCDGTGYIRDPSREFPAMVCDCRE